MASRQIDDAQPPVAERRPIVQELSRIVWTAMRDDITHPRHPLTIVRAQQIRGDDSRNPAHIP
jgi:hypothetical protein